MSQEGRRLIFNIFKNFINSLKPRKFQGKSMGRDYLGNEYFEVTFENKRPSRWYVPKNKDESRFDEQLPAEWEAWLRQRRKVPPSEEEISRNLELMETKKKNSIEIDAKFGTKSQLLQQPLSISFPKYEDLEQIPGKRPKT